MIFTAALLSQSDLLTLTSSGMTLMVLCVGFVLALCAFCFWHILRDSAPSDRHHAPLDIDTHDADL